MVSTSLALGREDRKNYCSLVWGMGKSRSEKCRAKMVGRVRAVQSPGKQAEKRLREGKSGKTGGRQGKFISAGSKSGKLGCWWRGRRGKTGNSGQPG